MSIVAEFSGGHPRTVLVDTAGTVGGVLAAVHAALELKRPIEEHEVLVCEGGDGGENVSLAGREEERPEDVGIRGFDERVEVSLKYEVVAREKLREAGIDTEELAVEALEAAVAEDTPAGWERARLISASRLASLLSLVLDAVKSRDADTLRDLLVNGAPVRDDVHDDPLCTPLICAVRPGYPDIVRLLLEHGADVNYRAPSTAHMALHVAATLDKADVARVLLEFSADIDSPDSEGVTPLIRAAQTGCLPIVEMLLRAGAVVDATDALGRSALFKAASGGHMDIVKLLIKKGASLSRRDRQGSTLLHAAATTPRSHATLLFIEKGLEVDAEDDDGMTPMFIAAQHGHVFVMGALATRGAAVDRKLPKSGLTPLWYACEGGFLNAVNLCLEGNADVHVASPADGATALHMAARSGCWAGAVALVAHGADPSAVDHRGRTAILQSGCGERAYKKAVEELVKLGADVNHRDHEGRTALWLAADDGLAFLVEGLAALGGHVDAADNEGVTPLAVATSNGHRRAVHTLIRLGADVNH